MRYKFTLKLVDPLRNRLPVNYQFELGSWFYRMLNNPDTALYAYLVSAAYVSNEEPFKYFVFSHLMVPDRTIEGDRLVIGSERIGLVFATIPDESLVKLVHENFRDARFLLGDRISQVSFHLEKIEQLPEPEFNEKMTFKTISPLHIGVKIPGRKNEVFLSPESSGYAYFFYENLYQKYKLLMGHDHPYDVLAGKFKLRSPVTQKGITMRYGRSGQIKVVGYQLRFRLQADPVLLRIGWYLGFGEKNHLGFGCCESL
jgi:CRISPR-associated endoribonuclease Cas6